MQTFTPREYLFIDIANTFGLDRTTWKDRINWTQQHFSILEAHEGDAKDPILYRKAVRALRAVDSGMPTRHIMGLDATASGQQILACLSGCKQTAQAVNLTDPSKRYDIYDAAATYMNTMGHHFTRTDLKKPLMTTFYGSVAQPKALFGEGTPELSSYYGMLKERLKGAYELMLFIQKHIDPTKDIYQWTLPDGHVARVPVMQVIDRKIEVDEMQHMKFKYRTTVIAPREDYLALAANFVHSLDAWICREMIVMADRQGYWLAPVHDCFLTSPKYMNQVRANYNTLLARLCKLNLVGPMLSEITGTEVTYEPLSTDLWKRIRHANYSLS